jgi:hypothetical protein
MTEMTKTPLMPLKAGLIGAGIQASLTPSMHMREGAAQGFDYQYELIDLNEIDASVDDLPALLSDAETRGLSGLNITYPCKQAVLPFSTTYRLKLGLSARSIPLSSKGEPPVRAQYGLVGFAEGFRRGLPGADLSSAVQLGAGGAGVATAYAILSLGLRELTVIDREPERAASLAAAMSCDLSESNGQSRSGRRAGHAPCRWPNPCDPDRDGQTPWHASAGRSAAADYGCQRSSISRSKPSFCARRICGAAGH